MTIIDQLANDVVHKINEYKREHSGESFVNRVPPLMVLIAMDKYHEMMREFDPIGSFVYFYPEDGAKICGLPIYRVIDNFTGWVIVERKDKE